MPHLISFSFYSFCYLFVFFGLVFIFIPLIYIYIYIYILIFISSAWLICVKHAASVHPGVGSNSPWDFIIALLIISLFVNKTNLKLSFISRYNLYPFTSYSLGVCSQKCSHPYAPHVNPTSLLSTITKGEWRYK